MWVTWVQFDTSQPQLVYNYISTVPVCTKWVELIHNVPSTTVQREYCWLRSFFPISSVFPPYVSADWAENNRTWSWNWWSDLRIVMSDPCPWTRTRPPCPTGRGSSCPSWRGEVGHVRLLLHADSSWLNTPLSDSLSLEFYLYSLKDVTKWLVTGTSPIPVDHASTPIWLQNANKAKMEQIETDLSMQYSDLLGIHSSSL